MHTLEARGLGTGAAHSSVYNLLLSFIFSISHPSNPIMTETDLVKPSGRKLQHGENPGPENKRSRCNDATTDAILDKADKGERSSPESSFEGEKASPSSTNTAAHVAPLPPVSASLSSAQLSGLYYHVLFILLLFAFWRFTSFSVSVQTASSSNWLNLNNTNSVHPSTFHCNPWLCYSASFSIGKSKDTLPSTGLLTTTLISPILKKCEKNNQVFFFRNKSNGRLYELMCSDAYMQALTDMNVDIGKTGSCLTRCILEDHGCEGVLYLIDRPFERNCFFLHNDERPMFGAGERVVGATLMKG